MIRLAEAMFRTVIGPGELSDDDWARWRTAARRALEERLGADAAVFVVDHPDGDGRLVACGSGIAVGRLPNPHHPHGRVGYVQWMSTDPGFRRRGHGRAVLRAVLAWFAERGVDNVELHATAQAEPLYRSEGFWHGRGGEPMRRRPWDPPPADSADAAPGR